MHVCMCMYEYVCTYAHMYVVMYVCVYVYMYFVCIYVLCMYVCRNPICIYLLLNSAFREGRLAINRQSHVSVRKVYNEVGTTFLYMP